MKIKAFLFVVAIFSSLFFSGDVFGASVYYCPTNGSIYGDNGACSASCIQSSACNAQFNASGNITTKNIDWLTGGGNIISFQGRQIFLGSNAIISNPSTLNTGFSTNCLKRVWASGENLNRPAIERTLSLRIPGANMSGDSGEWQCQTGTGNVFGVTNLQGIEGKLKYTTEKLDTSTRFGGMIYSSGEINLGAASCPLSGGSACSGAYPGVCSASQSCQIINLIDNAQFISYANLPSTVTPGQSFAASITLRNSGDTTWTQGANFKLGSQNPQDNSTWASNRINLPVTSVAPGQQVTFTQNFIAPTTLGIYNFQWQMLIEGVKWFGQQSNNQQITVVDPFADGACGSASRTFSSAENSWGAYSFCSAGTASPLNPIFPSAGAPTNWICSGSGGGAPASCSANKECVSSYSNHSCYRTSSVDCGNIANCGQSGTESASCLALDSCTGGTVSRPLSDCGASCVTGTPIQCPACPQPFSTGKWREVSP